MKRITISLPDDLADALERESRQAGESVSAIVRKAVEARLPRLPIIDGKRHIPFASLGRSGHGTLARDMEEIMAEEWTRENLIDRNR